MKVRVTDELKAYIEHKYDSMLKESKKSDEKQDKYKAWFDTERQKVKRRRDRDLKDLSRLKDTGIIDNDQQYQSMRKKIIYKSESFKRKQGTAKENPLKGKSNHDLNIFLYSCYYFIRRENPDSSDLAIYKWIEKKLAEKDFKLKGKIVYDYDNIRQKISKFKKDNESIENACNGLIEASYSRFLKTSR